MGIYKT